MPGIRREGLCGERTHDVQTRWQSTCEVLVDFLCSLLINIGAQLAWYQASATTERVTLFASLVLGSTFVRRFIVRRIFEALVPRGTKQPHWQSAIEAVSDTLLGFAMAVLLQILIYGEAATLLHASLFTAGIYAVAMLRRYVIRRVFAAWALRTAV